MFKNSRGLLFAAFTALTLSACGGGSVGGDNGGVDPGPDPTGPSSTPAAVNLVSTTNTLRADATAVSNGVPLTAIVTDARGNTVSGATVVFQLVAPNNSGAVTVTKAVTEEDGTATATLTTGGNATFPRTISVRAGVGTLVSATRNFSVVNPNTPVDPVQVSRVDLFASAAELFNDADSADEGVTVTAVVTNDNGNVVNNVPVSFSITAGSPAALQVLRGTTDGSGTAAAVLHTSGNSTPRNIALRASVTANGATITRDLVIPVVVRASALTLSLSSARLPSATNAPVTLRARATDSAGNPLANVPVTLALSSGTADITSATTDSTGRTPLITITNGGDPTPRTITITARAPGVSTTTTTVDVVPVVSAIRLLSSATTLRADADTAAEGVNLTAVLSDSSGAAVAGETVTFRITSGDALLAVVRSATDSSGSATAVVTTLNPVFPRSVSIQATAQGLSQALTLAVVDPNTPTTPVQVSAVDLFASEPSLRADADTAAEGVVLTTVVTSASGNVVAGVPVNFTLVSGTPASLQVTRGTTDDSGTATAVLTTAGNSAARNIMVRASVTVGGSTFVDDLTVPVVGAATNINGTVSALRLPSNNSIPVTVRARATNATGNVVANVPVTFFVSSGSISPATVVTNSSGETPLATITTGGDPTPRLITVTMTAPGAEADSIDIEVVPAVTAIQLLSSSSSLKADADTVAEALSLTAVLTDVDGNLITGEPVTFRILSPGVGALQVVRGTTDDTGTAVVNLTTGGNATFPRNITIEARAQNTTAQRTINVVDPASPTTPLPVADVELFSGSSVLFSDADTSAEGAGLSAIVTDSNGNVVANVPVSFTLSLVSGSGTPGALQVLRNTTDATGIATAVLTTSGNTSIRTVRVTARVTVGGNTFTDTLDLPVVGRAATVSVSLSDDKLFNDNSQPVTVSVTAEDESGNAAANVPVSLNVSSGSLSQTDVVTDGNGRTPDITLTTGGNATLRTIRLNVIAQGDTAFADIQVVPAVQTLQVTSAAPRLLDSAGSSVVITALARSSTGAVLSDIPVTFSVTGTGGRNGAVQATSGGVTGPDGRATALLTLGNAQAGDNLTVTATFARQPPFSAITGSTTVEVISQIASIDLISTSTQLSSAATQTANGVVLTALVKDRDQNVVSNAAVSFAIVAPSTGLLTPVRLTTDASGTAQVTLTTGGDPTDRAITVRATSASATNTVVINVVGTRLSISGPTSVQEGVATDYIATLVDDAGRGVPGKVITLTTTSGTVTAVDASTNVNGQMTFRLSAGSQATATLTATALGETATQTVNITNDSLMFTVLPAEANLNANTTVTVQWLRSGGPVMNQPVTFSTSRGSVTGAVTVLTDGAGFASTMIQSAEAGVATVIARGRDTTQSPARTPVVLQDILFVATDPATVSIEAEPTVIGPNQQSTVTAVVRDGAGNLVKDITVNFVLTDSTNGKLSAGSAITDTQGRASVIYTSSSTPSALNGVRIQSNVGASITDQVFITVGARSARIVLGTGNSLNESADFTRYELPYTAIVTDNAGNAAPDATLRLTLNPTFYYKGFYVEDVLEDQWVQVITAECLAEDLNNDGILDAGEDLDGDGQLDPSNPGAPSQSSPPLSSAGVAQFFLSYPQDRGNWVRVQLTARASVSGTEAIERANFDLPVLADDLELDSTPPGFVSPFGTLSRCDLDDDLVPRVSIAPASLTVNAPEGATDSTVTVVARLSKTSPEDIIVTVALDTTDIDVANRATLTGGAADVVLTTTQIVFPAGSTTANIQFDVQGGDAITENAENFNVRLGSVLTNNAIRISGSNQRALVTIPANSN